MTGPEKKLLAPSVDIPGLVAKGARLLQQAGVKDLALIGGGAMRAYGLDRATKDVDFAVRESALVAVMACFAGTTRALQIGGLSLTLPDGGTIDLIDRRKELRTLYEEALVACKRLQTTVIAQDIEVPVVPAEYLIAMKLAAGRPQDEADISFLLKLPTIDYQEARKITKLHLGFFAAKYLDRLALLAGRAEVTTQYNDENSDA
jgi:hypothetical protein